MYVNSEWSYGSTEEFKYEFSILHNNVNYVKYFDSNPYFVTEVHTNNEFHASRSKMVCIEQKSTTQVLLQCSQSSSFCLFALLKCSSNTSLRPAVK